MEYVLPLILFAGLAVFAGVLLTYLSHKFPGQATDDELNVREALPGLKSSANFQARPTGF